MLSHQDNVVGNQIIPECVYLAVNQTAKQFFELGFDSEVRQHKCVTEEDIGNKTYRFSGLRCKGSASERSY